MWLMLYTNRNAKPDPNVAEKYKPFARKDYDDWHYLPSLITHFFFWPRYILGWCWFFQGMVFVWTVLYGHVEGTPYKVWQKKVIWAYAYVVSWGCMLAALSVPITKRVHYDYSKYLGDDYKYTYEGAGI